MFNAALFRKTRGSLRQREFAERLGIGKSYVSAIENGLRIPSLEIVSRLVLISGIPAGEWLPGENPATVISDVQNELHQQRLEYIRLQEKLWNIEQEERRLKAKNHLYERLFDILLRRQTKAAKEEKIRELVINVIQEGVLNFGEIHSIAKVERSLMRSWLEAAKRPYKCQLAEGGKVMAMSPDEAALSLKCASCMKHDNGECLGHGANEHPEDILKMMERLEAHGIYSDAEQSSFLEKYYDISLSPEELRNTRYKAKMGLPIPYDKLYMCYLSSDN